MIRITTKGDYKSTLAYLNRAKRGFAFSSLDKYGKEGVLALQRATPVDTGLTARSWAYRVIKDSRRPGIEWYNTNSRNGTAVAILIQYGHGTGTGGYVQGRDYINPAMRPVFDKIATSILKEVTSWQA